MKIALISLNAKYIHTNLAIRCLAESVRSEHDVDVFDFTIHDLVFTVAKCIRKTQPDVIGLSTYIWNRTETFRLAKVLKKVMPEAFLLVGGPEVGAHPEAIMSEIQEIDGIIVGEGEIPFSLLLKKLSCADGIAEVPNLIWRNSSHIQRNPSMPPPTCLDYSPFPYKEENWDRNRIYYYESSRGCPFACSFCLSSLDQSVRSLSWDRVQQDLAALLKAEARIVKFVDRTFNWDKKRAMMIWQYLTDHYNESMIFHFEIGADLLDAESIRYLTSVPSGYFQFEIGVQSTNLATLQAIDRKADLDRIFHNVRMLKEAGNIHLHLDLIVGLPHEDLASLRKSFNRVYAAGANMLQIGFLKVLPGTPIHGRAAFGDYVFMPDPPYQVLSNRWLTFTEIGEMIDFEEIFDIYSNSGRFIYSLSFLENETEDAFSLFRKLTEFWQSLGLAVRGTGLQMHYAVLDHFAQAEYSSSYERFSETLKFDYCRIGKPNYLPEWFPETETISGKSKQKLLETLTVQMLPHLAEESSGMLRKNTEFVYFSYDCIRQRSEKTLYLFDYSRRDLGGQATWMIVDPQLILDVLDIQLDKGE